MAEVQELEQEIEGVETEVSQETVPSTANDAAATRQPENKKVNLDELPEFRQFKSATDKRIADMERRYQAQLAQAQAAEQAARQRQLATLDPEERTAYELEEARREAAFYREQAQQTQILEAKRNALQGIAERTKVPVDILMEAESPDHAWAIAWEHNERKAQEAAKQTDEAKQEREKKRAANKVDLGSGAPVPPVSEWERTANQLLKTRNGAGYVKHILNARKGQ